MEEYDKRVTAMYNDCWKLYRDYTKSHDMRQFNEAKDAVIKKYDRQCDVIDLVLWIAIRVQTLTNCCYMQPQRSESRCRLHS